MENIRLHKLLGEVGHRICGGGKSHFNCYGKNTRVLRFGDGDNQLFAECVFEPSTLDVYELSYLQGKNEQGQTIKYLWRHPEYKVAYRKLPYCANPIIMLSSLTSKSAWMAFWIAFVNIWNPR